MSVVIPLFPAGKDHAWMEHANCAGLPTEMFFPERGEDFTLGREARKVCAACVVQPECLE